MAIEFEISEALERQLSQECESLNFFKVVTNIDQYTNCKHNSHVFIYASTDAVSLEEFPVKAIVLMQLRFDGSLGFFGGQVDEGETPLEGLNRELKEEMSWCEEDGPVKEIHNLFTHASVNKNVLYHFYGIKVTEDKIKNIEARCLKAACYGDEVFGIVRVPLFIMNDGYKGFPAFLNNNFVGNAKQQLIKALVSLNIVSADFVLQALTSSHKFHKT